MRRGGFTSAECLTCRVSFPSMEALERHTCAGDVTLPEQPRSNERTDDDRSR
jgi:hypothetical protein